MVVSLPHVPNIVEGPLEHSEYEWSKFQSILIENTKDEPTSLENEYPHIIKVFELIFIICIVILNH